MLLTSVVSFGFAGLLEVVVGALTLSSGSLTCFFSCVTGAEPATSSSSFISGFNFPMVGEDIFGEVATLVLSSSASLYPGFAVSR
jgi:hypothetical protein